MKTLMHRYSLLLLFSFLCGCVYQTEIYSPDAISSSDHPQGNMLFLHRDNLSAEAWAQDGRYTLEIRLLFSMVNEPATFSSDTFYIESGSEKLNPIAPVKLTFGSGEADGSFTREILQGNVLMLQFPQEVQTFSSFVLHLPAITTGNGKAVPNLNSITFTKKKVWKAITIN